MRHLGISGGGTKITGLFGACEELIQHQGYRPHVISGISAGAILALPIAMGKWAPVREILERFTLKTFFSHAPVNRRGKLTLGAYARLLTGKHYLGRQDALVEQLKKVIHPDHYTRYRHDATAPVVYVGTVDRRTGERIYFNLKETGYKVMLQAIAASAAIPVFTKGEFLFYRGQARHLYDGGLRDHCPTPWVLQHSDEHDHIRQTVSIYSRPADYRLQEKSLKPKNALATLQDYVDIANVEVSKMDEQLEDLLCERLGIAQHKYFLPSVMHSVYDTDRARLNELWEQGKQVVRQDPVQLV